MTDHQPPAFLSQTRGSQQLLQRHGEGSCLISAVSAPSQPRLATGRGGDGASSGEGGRLIIVVRAGSAPVTVEQLTLC